MNYYNDNDPKVCAWLRELITAGEIAPGVVDCRSILEVKADELEGYDLKLRVAQDYEFWTRAARITEFANLRDVLLRYRTHNTRMSVAYAQSMHEDALAISKNAISAALGKNVSLRALNALALPSSVESPRDLLEAAKMFRDLCLQYTRRAAMSHAERGLIRRDSARTLLDLTMLCMRKSVVLSLLILSTAVRLAPEDSFRLLISSIFKAANRRRRRSWFNVRLSVRKAEQRLGFMARTTLEDGLRATID